MSSDGPEQQAASTLGPYALGERVGSGGMASVYRAVDRRTGTTVAVKTLHESLGRDPEQLERFRREAHVASLLRSPYTVRLLEFGQVGGRHYLVSEFVDGRPLSDVLVEGPIEPSRAISMATQVALALEEARTHGIVHRDIKPDNILVTGDRSVQVADFGIATLNYAMGFTMPGTFVGTVAYSAPEQHYGKADTRSDIYSLGCVLFEMLDGSPPFRAPTTVSLMFKHETEPPPMERLAAMPSPLRQLVARCIAKSPDDRFQTPAELVAALNQAAEAIEGRAEAAPVGDSTAVQDAGGAGASPPPPQGTAGGRGAGRGRRLPGGKRILSYVAVAAASLLIGAGAYALTQIEGGEDARAGVPATESADATTSTATPEPTQTSTPARTLPADAPPATPTASREPTRPAPTATPTPTPTVMPTATATPTATPTMTATATATPSPTATETSTPPPPKQPPPGFDEEPRMGLIGFSTDDYAENALPPGGTINACWPSFLTAWVEYEHVPEGAVIEITWFHEGEEIDFFPMKVYGVSGVLWFDVYDPAPGEYLFEISVPGEGTVVKGGITIVC